MHDDCNDCGESIEICGEDGIIQPDSEISCPNCGAVHVVQVEDSPRHDPQDDYVYLTLTKHGAEVIAELRERVKELEAACDAPDKATILGWFRLELAGRERAEADSNWLREVLSECGNHASRVVRLLTADPPGPTSATKHGDEIVRLVNAALKDWKERVA